MFLTRQQLHEMTGYVRPAEQCRWLAENNYQFDVRSDGRPNVMVEQVRMRQCGERLNVECKPVPDLSFLSKAS